MAAIDKSLSEANAQLQARIAELECERDRERDEKLALREVARTAGSTLDVEAVLEAIAAQASSLGECGSSIFEFDESAAVLHFRYTGRMDAFPAEPMQRLMDSLRAAPVPLGAGLTGRAAETRAPLQVADTEMLPATALRRDLLLASGIRSMLYLPLLFQDRLLGVFNIIRPVPGEFSPELIELLEVICRLLCRSYSREHQRGLRLVSLEGKDERDGKTNRRGDHDADRRLL